MNQLQSQLEDIESRLAGLKRGTWEHREAMEEKAALKVQMGRVRKEVNADLGTPQKKTNNNSPRSARRAQREKRWRDSDAHQVGEERGRRLPEQRVEEGHNDEDWEQRTAMLRAKREAEQRQERNAALAEGRALERQQCPFHAAT